MSAMAASQLLVDVNARRAEAQVGDQSITDLAVPRQAQGSLLVRCGGHSLASFQVGPIAIQATPASRTLNLQLKRTGTQG